MALVLAASLCGLAWPGHAPAQPAAGARAPSGYRGVVPGGTDQARPTKKRVPGNRVTWIGFQPRSDGSARLFVQLTSEATYTQRIQDGVLVVQIEGVRFHRTGKGRRLDTRYFGTALAQVSSRQVGKRKARRDRAAQAPGIELRIEFKSPSDAREANASIEAQEDGHHYLFLDFGPSGIRISQ